MSDWFNDPFFDEKASFPHGDIFSHVNETFKEFDKHMNRMMNEAFGNFGRMGIGFDDDFGSSFSRPAIGMNNSNNSRSHRPSVEEVDDTHTSSNSRAPRVEEPDDYTSSRSRNYNKSNTSSSKHSSSRNYDDAPAGNTKPYYYSSSYVSYSNADGTVSAKRKDTDSSGKTHMAEMRRLGDKTVVYDRKIDSDGKTTDSRKVHGMNDSEVDSFNQNWESKIKSDPFLSHMGSRNAGIGYSPKKESRSLGYSSSNDDHTRSGRSSTHSRHGSHY